MQGGAGAAGIGFPIEGGKQAEPRVLSPLRTRTALPISEWEILWNSSRGVADRLSDALLNKIGLERDIWYKMLFSKYGVGGSPDVLNVILRVANLAFYKSFCLLEVLEKTAESYRRSYALIRSTEHGLDIRPLNGKSHVIHKINGKDDKPRISKPRC